MSSRGGGVVKAGWLVVRQPSGRPAWPPVRASIVERARAGTWPPGPYAVRVFDNWTSIGRHAEPTKWNASLGTTSKIAARSHQS